MNQWRKILHRPKKSIMTNFNSFPPVMLFKFWQSTHHSGDWADCSELSWFSFWICSGTTDFHRSSYYLLPHEVTSGPKLQGRWRQMKKQLDALSLALLYLAVGHRLFTYINSSKHQIYVLKCQIYSGVPNKLADWFDFEFEKLSKVFETLLRDHLLFTWHMRVLIDKQ